HLGPVRWDPGAALGAPDHPHRGFETVTYVLAGENEHRDSFGNADVLRPGDVQWMTAGGGVIHSEMPTARFHREGGVQEGFQIWVNLPAADKMMTPRYQTLRADDIPRANSADGRVAVRIIAGESLGRAARIDTRVPIQMLHFTIQPGGATLQSVPAEQNGLIYVFKGVARIGSDEREVREGQAALLESGDGVAIAVDADAKGPAELLLLSGKPLNEPVARYGPFVMNTREQIEQAFRDYQSGRFGVIPATRR
ncbi:MAG TPA: pirin family protein, partial [Steroidobacteraceae bacterium]|nr:pirin family protein [Steroidobacteraceae bacterium]